MRAKNTLLILILAFIINCHNNNLDKTLLFYCAAGMKPAISKIAKNYYDAHGIQINIQYGGSGTLLANLRISRKGDLYLAADQSYMEKAKSYKLINETQALANLYPVIGVKRGNPLSIYSLSDLKKEGVRLAFGNPSAASIGRQTKKLLLKAGQWEDIQKNIMVLKPIVNDLANDLKIGAVDAVIIWDAIGKQYPEIENIAIEGLIDPNNKATYVIS